MQNIKHVVSQLASLIALLVACGSLSGCITTSGAAFGAASGAMAAGGVGDDFKYYVFDVPPQVIYRIDDHRFFTLENYKDCDHGGLAYYNDTKWKIKKYVGGGSDSNSILNANPLMSWRGQFIYAASDNVIAYISRRPRMSDRDTNSGTFLSYEINNKHERIFVADDSDPGWGVTIGIMDDRVYKKNKGIPGGDFYNIPAKSPNEIKQRNRTIKISGSVEDLEWPQLKTPSGATRFTCDNTIKSVNVSVTPDQAYAVDATEVPKHE